MKRRYTVRLVSDDVEAEHAFYLTDAERDLLLRVAAAFNASHRFSVDPRMVVEPSPRRGEAA